MPKVTKILGYNKARAWESLGFAHKKRLCQHFDTTSLFISFVSDILCYKLISPITGVVGNNYSGNSNVSVKPLYKIPYPPSTATAPRIANSNLLP